MTELLTPSAPAPSSPAPEPPSRSGLVTASGIIVAILPPALLATVLMMSMMSADAAPVWSMFKREDIGTVASTSIFLVVLAVVTFAGAAIAKRWRGWRVYSGTIGWFFVILSIFIVGIHLQRLEFAPDLMPSSASRVIGIIVAAGAAMLGILLLVAKRAEPPPQPARPMTAIGIVTIAIGFVGFAAAAIYAPDGLTAALPAAIGGAIALIGIGIVVRGPGWRIYTGCFAWFLIVAGIAGFFVNMPGAHDPRWISRMWMNAATSAVLIGVGHFILWSKRREPRPPTKQKEAVPAP